MWAEVPAVVRKDLGDFRQGKGRFDVAFNLKCDNH
jgi:hypothetical protein